MFKKLIIAALIFFPLLTNAANTAEGITLSIAPPLIKNNVNPGQVWKSSLKVVNNNATDVEVYTQVLDFKSGDNGNTVEFLPLPSEKDKADKVRLSSWIFMEDKKLTIPAFKSVDVSFIIDVPKEAEPGGHYAAILVGTVPPSDKVAGSVVKVSSMLSSLILLSVGGDIREEGRIREFSTDKDVYFDPKVNFKVKFENLGNVHIQPQGEIRITDFFGKSKEVITLNHKSEFGNVLPANSRIWDFSWKGSGNLTEMGRYKAQLVLTYGSVNRETIDQTLFFWVIYLKPLLIIVGSLLFLFLLIFFSIRSYIRRSIRSVQMANGINPNMNKKASNNAEPKKIISSKQVSIASPPAQVLGETKRVVVGERKVVNLKSSSVAQKTEEPKTMKKAKMSGFKKFMIILLVVLLLAAGVFAYFYFFQKTAKTDYSKLYQDNKSVEQVKTEESAIAVASSSEPIKEVEVVKTEDDTIDKNASSSENSLASSTEITDEQATSSATSTATSTVESTDMPEVVDEIVPKANGELLIKVLNGGGVAGMANKVVELIGQKKYKPAQVGNADNYDYTTTLIRYKKGDVEYANEIKALVDRKAVVEEAPGQEEDVVIIIGKSFTP